MEGVIGLDIGTGSARAVLLNENGHLECVFDSSYHTYFPELLYAEQNPEDWWQASLTVLKKVAEYSNRKKILIKSIGLTGQMHGVVLMSHKGEVLRPAIIWMDQRSKHQALHLKNQFEARGLMEVVMNEPLTNFSLTKVAWVMENEPEIWANTAHVLLPKDYIRYRLSGDLATDVTDASGTLLFDIKSRNWARQVFELVGLKHDQFANVFESSEPTGTVKASIAESLNLPKGVLIVAGAGDQPAAAIGIGVYSSGSAMLSVGTSGVILAPTALAKGPLKDGLHMFSHAVKNTSFVMGVTQAAGGSLKWFRDTLAPHLSFNQLSDLAEGVEPGAKGLFFTPYLAGERSPHPDPDAKGIWLGLTNHHDLSDMIRSVMEGVAYSLRDVLESVEQITGVSLQIRGTGGIVNSITWRRIFQAILERDISWVVDQGPSIGAAVLAGKLAFSEAFEAINELIEPVEVPKEWSDVYISGHRQFAKIYDNFLKLEG